MRIANRIIETYEASAKWYGAKIGAIDANDELAGKSTFMGSPRASRKHKVASHAAHFNPGGEPHRVGSPEWSKNVKEFGSARKRAYNAAMKKAGKQEPKTWAEKIVKAQKEQGTKL